MKNAMTLLYLVLLLSLFACQSGSEEDLVLDEGVVELEFHQRHVGEILFDTRYRKPAEQTEAGIRSALVLTSDDELIGHIFLAKTQTHYLDQLAPGRTVNNLCKSGSFQLTFYVDEAKLYTYNLQTGAGSCWFRNSATAIYLPLISEDDHWGKFLWMKFIRREGGQEALADGSHQLKIEIRPYIESPELQVGEIIAEGEVSLQFVDREVSGEEKAVHPIAPNSGWEVASKKIDDAEIERLNEKMAQGIFKNVTSIVVVRNEELLLEEYFNGAGRDTLHDTRSVGKSFVSALLGIAIDDGHIASELSTLGEFYELESYRNYSAAKGRVSLKDLITMSSQFAASDLTGENSEDVMQQTDDWMDFTLNLSVNDKDASQRTWNYWTPGTMVVGDVINRTVPGGMEAYADEKLFAPLGISAYKWFHTPRGLAYAGGGLEMNSLSLARFGQLYLSGGLKDGKQVVPRQWVDTSLSRHLPIPEREGEYYGYLFWSTSYTSGDTTYEVFYASGNGGNKIFIIQELDLVIVITATAYGQPYAHVQADEMMEDFILPAVL